jgi:hypothetical protein
VDLAADPVRDAGDGALARDLSGALEPVYASAADPAERMAKFESVYRRLFAEWGYEGLLAGALDEFPVVTQSIESVWLKHAERGETAGADLGGAKLRQLGVLLPAPLCLDPEALRSQIHFLVLLLGRLCPGPQARRNDAFASFTAGLGVSG